jgi:hypothetical protein
MPVSHNPCALVHVVREELAQPGTSCCLMHPCAFNIGPKAVDGSDASISGFVLACSYLGKMLGSKYILYCMMTSSATGDVGIRFAVRFGQYF